MSINLLYCTASDVQLGSKWKCDDNSSKFAAVLIFNFCRVCLTFTFSLSTLPTHQTQTQAQITTQKLHELSLTLSLIRMFFGKGPSTVCTVLLVMKPRSSFLKILWVFQQHNKLVLYSSKKVLLEWCWNQILDHIPYFHPSLSCVKFVFHVKRSHEVSMPIEISWLLVTWNEMKWLHFRLHFQFHDKLR